MMFSRSLRLQWVVRRPTSARARRAGLAVIALAGALCAAPTSITAQRTPALPASLTDREFWDFFTSMSEDGGYFVSENFVSNEQTYQHVIPTLQSSLTPGGVYLGVGPEQNFTYIANLKPRLAVIFDIRRQNAMQHLMYKALIELSPTRADFVSRLFSRPLPPSLGPSSATTELFAAATAAEPSDSAYEANRKAIADRLTIKHGFALSADDLRSIIHVYGTFFEAGPEINYGYRAGQRNAFGSSYPTFGRLQELTNAAGVNMAFLATEANYQAVRSMHLNNLIVPVVGDFAGPKAIRAVGDYLRERRATVTAFYLSNVEQYLFRQGGDAERFYRNCATLPIDSTSMFIRSIPPGARMVTAGWPLSTAPWSNSSWVMATSGGRSYSVEVRDSAGVRIILTTRDSAGQSVTTRTIDSTGTGPRSPLEIFRSLRARDDSLSRSRVDSALRNGGNWAVPMIMLSRDSSILNGRSVTIGGPPLISGLASIRATLDAFDKGELGSYSRAIGMTKTEGWR